MNACAAPIAPQVLEFFWALGVPICEGYGQTEGTGLATFNRPGRVRLGTVGTALPEVEVRIADDGEILIRGHNVMKGYYRNPQATAAAIRDGWFHTGDIGRMDEAGNFYIVDRLKELIKYKGFQVAPAELEALLLTHPAVADALHQIGDARSRLGDQTEAALRVAALKGNVKESELAAIYPRIHELPFDARRKRMSTIHQVDRYAVKIELFTEGGADQIAFVKGAPREVLQAALGGKSLCEMKRNRTNTSCCGAGGGRMWMEEEPKQRVNTRRVDQALETNPDVVAVA